MNNITIITSAKNWLEQNAVEQLKQISTLPGVTRVVGLPDLHPGKTPVGVVTITQDIIYPHIIGNDIGCGITMLITEIENRKSKLERMIRRMEAIPDFSEIPLTDIDFEKTQAYPWQNSLGTIGGGNHFAELQEVETVYDLEQFNKLGLHQNLLSLLVHSGSRGYGQAILEESIRDHQAQNGLLQGSEAFTKYFAKHDDAVQWAKMNRQLISYRFMRALGTHAETNELLNSTHNGITIRKTASGTEYIHRKGAAPAEEGLVVIPGSRGSLTYLVEPTGDLSLSEYSLAHGAGRKWERYMCKPRLETKYTKESIKTTPYKGRVICNDRKLLFEEAPEAYKNIDQIIQCLIEFGLIQVIATFKPVLTYKG